MNKISILLVIMTTFYLDGCVSNNESAIEYFDGIYLPIQEVIELDNIFQESIHEMLIATEDLENFDDTLIEEEQYDLKIERIKSTHYNLSSFINDEIIKMKTVQVYNNEIELQRGGLAILEVYRKVSEGDFIKMIDILEKVDHNEKDAAIFNESLKESNKLLNYELENFYNIAYDYGDQYGIDLEAN